MLADAMVSGASPGNGGGEKQRLSAGHLAPQLLDGRFRRLVGEQAWAELPAAVRRRFSKRLGPGDIALYRGVVVETTLSRAGRVLAFLGRAIGAPLPLTDGATGAAVVAVTEDEHVDGQLWTRSYARPGRFPQVVHSAKRFRGATGLEEHVGCGIGMALHVSVEDRALVFRSCGYFIEIAGYRVAIPHWLAPGEMKIVHREEEAGGRFSFRLTLTHARVGRLLHQLALFDDVV